MARETPVNTGYTIINGTSTGSNSAYVDCWLEYKVLGQSVENNTSQVRVLLYAACTKASSTAWTTAEKFGYVGYDGGNKQYKSTTYNFANKAVNCFGAYTFTITHNDDGKKTVTLEGAWKTSHSTYISGGSVSGEVDLPTIARASTIKATDADIGSVSMVTIKQNSSEFTHTVAYKFGDLTGYIDANGDPVSAEQKLTALSIPFTVPESFYAQIPNDPSGTCTLTCVTYLDTTQIGEAQTAQFTVTAKESVCKPTVTGTVVDVNEVTLALTGNEKTLIKYHSTAHCEIDAQAQNSASIAKMTVAGISVTEATVDIPNVENGTIEFKAVDSRGYPGTDTDEEVTMVDYIPLSNLASISRDDPTSGNATVTLSGSYWAGNFGAVDNNLEVQYSINGGDLITAEVDLTLKNGRYSGILALSGLDYTRGHTVEITVKDKLMEVSKTLKVQKGIPVFDWGENDFAFHVPVSVPEVSGVYLRGVVLTGKSTITLQSAFTKINSSNAGDQIIFLVGSKAHAPVSGTIHINSAGTVTWDGTAGITVSAMDDSGKVTITAAAYNGFVLLSAHKFEVL